MANILTSYYRPKPGGCYQRLARAMKALLADGHTVHYLSVQRFPIDHANCRFHRFPWPVGATENLLFWGVWHLLAPIWVLVIGLRQGITHAFAFQHTYGLIMQPLRLVTGIPITLFLRSDVIQCHLIKGQGRWMTRLLATFDRVLEGLTFGKVRLVFCSQALRDQVMSRHPRARPDSVSVLPNDIPHVESSSTRELFLPIRASFLGTLEPRKNPALVLHTVAELPENGLTLAYFGVGPETENLKELAKELGVEERVTFRGWVPNEQAWSETDLLLFPSVHEGSPNAVLEAIAHGVPVLAGDIAELRELVPSECLLPVDDAAPWTAALGDFLADPVVQSRSIAQKQADFAAHLRFDWNAEVCQQILKGAPESEVAT